MYPQNQEIHWFRIIDILYVFVQVINDAKLIAKINAQRPFFFTFPASNGVRSPERCLQSIWHHSLTTQRHVTCLIYEIKEFFGFWCYLVVIFSASTALNDIRSPERCSKLIRHHLLPKQTSEMPIKLHQRISWFQAVWRPLFFIFPASNYVKAFIYVWHH